MSGQAVQWGLGDAGDGRRLFFAVSHPQSLHRFPPLDGIDLHYFPKLLCLCFRVFITSSMLICVLLSLSLSLSLSAESEAHERQGQVFFLPETSALSIGPGLG